MSEAMTVRPPAPLAVVDRVIGIGLAIAAAMWHALLMTRATNDNFLHLTFAQQWLNGDWPVRDFFDQGWVLQYSLSAAAQLLLGERLAAEAVIVAAAWAISTYLVFALLRRYTGATAIALASALLLIVASARGYSYPKGIVYAVAATLWWRYIESPSARRAMGLGAWTAIAFYWRPDHGVYVAVAVALATIAAHGLRRRALVHCCVAGLVTLAVIAPFLVYVQVVYGVPAYLRTGLVQAEVEHESHGTHGWPMLRYWPTVLVAEPADHFAPIVGLRWRADSSPEQRQQVRSRYGLTVVSAEDGDVERVRLSASAILQVRALVSEPLVDDTAGIDRGAGVLSPSTWSRSQRWKFTHPSLRLQLLPQLDATARASEVTAAVFFLSPLVLLLASPWISARLPGVSATALASFAVFVLLVAWALIRNPFPARVADAVVLPGLALGFLLGGIWHSVAAHHTTRQAFARAGAGTVAAAIVMTVAGSGQFEAPWQWVGGGAAAYRELSASPPLAFYLDRPARFTLRLAAYVRECVPERDRLLVLWFEPEIYYYSGRLMAQRHAVFVPAWAALADEQRATLQKIERYAPPVVLARKSALDEYARASYPAVDAYVNREYQLAATVQDGAEEYRIYGRHTRTVLRAFAGSWPCYTPGPSRWASVGVSASPRH